MDQATYSKYVRRHCLRSSETVRMSSVNHRRLSEHQNQKVLWAIVSISWHRVLLGIYAGGRRPPQEGMTKTRPAPQPCVDVSYSSSFPHPRQSCDRTRKFQAKEQGDFCVTRIYGLCCVEPAQFTEGVSVAVNWGRFKCFNNVY